ncbi:MAG: hypothetical protein ABEI75_02660 [Halobaculum sp.]
MGLVCTLLGHEWTDHEMGDAAETDVATVERGASQRVCQRCGATRATPDTPTPADN